MTVEKVQELIAGFNFNPPPSVEEARSLERFSADAANYVIANSQALVPVASTFSRLRELIIFLNNDAHPHPRGSMLLAVNDAFELHLHKIKTTNGLVAKPLTLGAKCSDLRNLQPNDKQQLRAFYAAAQSLHSKDEEFWVEKIAGLFVEPDNAHNVNAALDVLAVLERIVAQFPHAPVSDTDRENARGRLGALNYSRVHHLIKIRNKYPDWKFTGFTRWGPGDQGAPDQNFKVHFLKHVCNSTRQFLDESVWWWRALEIRLPLSELHQPDPNPAETGLFQDGFLARNSVESFLDNYLLNRPALMDRLFDAYGPHYTAYALRLSREMNNVIVENTGMITGFGGRVIIFGRFDSDASQDVGISSCYFVLPPQRAVKLAENKSTMLVAMD
jgi:hypothetical protein